MRLTIDATLDYNFPAPADVLLQLEVAQLPDQKLIDDRLTVTSATALTPVSGLLDVGRRTWVAAQGRFVANYRATVEVTRPIPDFSSLQAVPLGELPGEVIHFLWPSRYVQSEDLKPFAIEQFGEAGGAAVLGMAEWTRSNIEYLAGSSDEATTGRDTFLHRKGICRDFAHVLMGFARALDIPARMVSAYAFGLDPPDFHAVAEVWLSDGKQAGWHLIDPTGLVATDAIARIGVGRDATDISFMTVFGGNAEIINQSVAVARVD